MAVNTEQDVKTYHLKSNDLYRFCFQRVWRSPFYRTLMFISYLELSIKHWAKDNSYFRAFAEPSASDMLIMDEAPARPPAWKP